MKIERIVRRQIADAIWHEYLDHYAHEGISEDDALDVRLCVDLDDMGSVYWSLQFGDVCYDTHHSMLCGAGVLCDDTVISELVDDLSSQVEDEYADLEVA